MAKATDLEGRFDQAMKKGEKQDKGRVRVFSAKDHADLDKSMSGLESGLGKKRTTSDGYMPRRKISDYTGDASKSEGWKEVSKERSVSDRKPILKSIVRNIKKNRKE